MPPPITALGLHALQHRGQEAVGITSFDGQPNSIRAAASAMWRRISRRGEALAELPGIMAAGHVRYSTTGGSGLRNVQPLFADLAARRVRDRAQRQHLERAAR